MDKRFSFLPTPISGLWIAESVSLIDERGSFARLFCMDEFSEIGLNQPIVQINHSFNKKAGTVRGLHFQHRPHTESKIVVCMKGEVFDVAVDIRNGSETFLGWHSEILSAKNQRSMAIPDGFAHGFQTLADDTELLYLHTGRYVPEAEDGLHVLDPQIAIAWPMPFHSMSDRDAHHPFVNESFSGIKS